jgi:uncharacterized protein
MTDTTDLFFVVRLIGPRSDFIQTVTDDERALMQAHAAHLMGWMQKGKIIVFGPVADPKGPWGLGVMRVSSEDEMREIEQNDPVIKSGRGFSYEVLPMLRAVVA